MWPYIYYLPLDLSPKIVLVKLFQAANRYPLAYPSVELRLSLSFTSFRKLILSKTQNVEVESQNEPFEIKTCCFVSQNRQES